MEMRVWMVAGDELWYREMRLYVAMYMTRVFYRTGRRGEDVRSLNARLSRGVSLSFPTAHISPFPLPAPRSGRRL